MALKDLFLPEFDIEMKKTRVCLERAPEDKFSWKPHGKSMPLGRLVSHLADIPNYGTVTITLDSLDLAPPGGEPRKTPQHTTRQALLDAFDKNVAEARAAITAASDMSLQQMWTLSAGGKTIFTLPRAAVLRTFMLSHLIHHRAQLGVYLRLNDVPVPSIYGPSADEPIF
ncbi:MAG TPA: DinB family protein [Terriglobia bacterium]|nr:DinB family protein [Terriglobia bacterium]